LTGPEEVVALTGPDDAFGLDASFTAEVMTGLSRDRAVAVFV